MSAALALARSPKRVSFIAILPVLAARLFQNIRTANWKHGRRSAAFIAERKEAKASVRLLRRIIAAL
jgi:hypothetical protein